MKPLNLKNYMLLSIKKVLPQIILLSIQIALFFFLCSIGSAEIYGINKNSTNFLDDYTSIIIKSALSEERKNQVIEEIKNIEGVEKQFSGILSLRASAKLIIFDTGAVLVEGEKDLIEYTFKREKARLLKGTMPKNQGEIIISKEISKYLGKDIGDYVRDDGILKKYKISGIYDGPFNTYIAYKKQVAGESSFVLMIKDGKAEEVYKELKKLNEDIKILINRDEILNDVSRPTNLLKFIGIIILLITAVDVTLSVSNLNRVYFTERCGEFAILQAVGYTEKFVIRRLLKELSIVILSGITGGIILGQSVISIFYYLYCEEKGIAFSMFEPWLIILAIILGIIIYLLSYIPVRKYINKMDWVEVLQQSNA